MAMGTYLLREKLGNETPETTKGGLSGPPEAGVYVRWPGGVNNRFGAGHAGALSALSVILAKAGIQGYFAHRSRLWIPAFAGMTMERDSAESVSS
ncbi:hypothetical protein [Sphingomonas sp. NPDC092410]|jgi:hypothetical protein